MFGLSERALKRLARKWYWFVGCLFLALMRLPVLPDPISVRYLLAYAVGALAITLVFYGASCALRIIWKLRNLAEQSVLH